jgi:hypothetical protein
VAWNRSTLSMPIHPMSFQCSRCVVSPLMTYFESVMIFSGVNGLIDCRATNTAIILLTWFECLLPGILIALFSGLFSLAYNPLLQVAFCFLLLVLI